jgi:hypothetical protein
MAGTFAERGQLTPARRFFLNIWTAQPLRSDKQKGSASAKRLPSTTSGPHKGSPPVAHAVVPKRGCAASARQMGRFETRWLTAAQLRLSSASHNKIVPSGLTAIQHFNW